MPSNILKCISKSASKLNMYLCKYQVMVLRVKLTENAEPI